MHWGLDLLLFFVAFVAGTIDTIAGGGGLITLPAILATGLPPQLALGTSKLQSTFGVGTASLKLYLKYRPAFKSILLGILFTALGACLGAYLALHLTNRYLREMIPPLLFLVLLYSIFCRRFYEQMQPARVSAFIFYPIFGIALGFYDGFLGPGVGAFWVIALVALLGFDLKTATVHTKIFNFTSNVVSLIWFVVMKHVAYAIGVYMIFGQILGGYFGAYLVASKGTRLIRPVFISMVTLLLLVLSYKTYNLGRFL